MLVFKILAKTKIVKQERKRGKKIVKDYLNVVAQSA